MATPTLFRRLQPIVCCAAAVFAMLGSAPLALPALGAGGEEVSDEVIPGQGYRFIGNLVVRDAQDVAGSSRASDDATTARTLMLWKSWEEQRRPQTGRRGESHSAQARAAVKHWSAILGTPLACIAGPEGRIEHSGEKDAVSVVAYRTEKGEKLIVLWRNGDRPDACPRVEHLTVSVPPSLWMTTPVWVDLRSGKVYKCRVTREQGVGITFRDVPVYDSPIVLAHLGILPFAPPVDPPCVTPEPGEGYRFVGTVRPRHAREIAGSNWSAGAETMDRDFTSYKHWRQYLGPLGVKRARIQSGWAKTEKEKGKYDFAWLDEIVPDMVEQGVKPWMCLCYGNPGVYGRGGGLGWSIPTAPEALDGWDRYVAAVVERYGQSIDEWEIWNEPSSPLDQYSAFVVRTAKVIRSVQPKAHIIVAAWGDVPAILKHLKQYDGLKLVNEFTIHPYSPNPDTAYTRGSGTWRVARLRELFASYAGHLTLRQGENGVPSRSGSSGALSEYAWTESTQVKWALRRLLADLGWDLPSSYFSICDMKYPTRINYKGLLAIREDRTIHHVKPAYYAVQRVTAIFDNTVHRIPDFAGTTAGAAEGHTYALYGYRTDSGASIATLWRDTHRPGVCPEIEPLTVTLPGMKFTQPVWVDLFTGRVYQIDASRCTTNAEATIIEQVSGYDSPVLIAEQDAIPLTPAQPD